MAYGKIHGYRPKVTTNNHSRRIIQKRAWTYWVDVVVTLRGN